jgi:SAM-dependent MidA family methyltransferase
MTAQNELGRRIARLIRAQGPLSIAQFMTIALHDAKSGYYATRDPLGADFLTAPEMTQIFGELVGLWCVQAWQDQGCPSPARLVELGPGRGTLMCDALRAARLAPGFLAAVEIVLIEASPVLAAMQCDRLGDCGAPVRWIREISQIAYDRPSFVIANEFLDALPVQQFVMTDAGWRERVVTADADDALSFAWAPVPASFRIPTQRGPAKPGAVYEVSPAAAAAVEDIARGIASAGGAALLIDYGYAANAFGDTLQAVGKHRFADILGAPGDVDLSCHVDFGAMARVVQAAGAQVYGPLEQGEFLQALGIQSRMSRLGEDDSETLAVQRLTDPEQMGTLFKVVAILPQGASAPPGFAKGASRC